MKKRSHIFISNHLARSALWAAVVLAVISTLGFSRADDSLPDAPSSNLLKNIIFVKMPSFELRLQPQANIGNKEVVVTDVSFNPSLPTSSNDLRLSVQTFNDGLTAIANGSTDQAWNNLIASTKSECPSLNINGIVSLLSMYGGALLNNYNYNMPWAPTPLNNVAESLVQNNDNAGTCRDIHTALAEIAGACGLKDVGAMFLNWQQANLFPEEPHAPAYYRDPTTGQFIVINYEASYNTGTKSLPQAADIASQALSDDSTAAYVETNIGTKSSAMHEIRTTRGGGILGNVENAANLSQPRPAVEISVGNLDISGSVQARHSLGGGFTVGVYGAGVDDRETKVLFGSVGGTIANDAHANISDKIEFNSNSQVTLGVFDIHDVDFADTVRNSFEGIVLLKTQNGVAWRTEHVPGSITATLEQADNYTPHFIGVPYNFLSLRLVLDPTQNARIHAQTTEIITTKTIQNTAFTLARLDDSAGVDLKKIIKGVSVDGDTTLRLLGGAGHGVTGDEENAKITYKGASVGGNVLVIQNRSNDYFYNVPLYCRAKVEYDKTIKGVHIQSSGEYRCNHDNKLSVPGEQPYTDDEWDIYKPRATVGLKISWGNQGKQVE